MTSKSIVAGAFLTPESTENLIAVGFALLLPVLAERSSRVENLHFRRGAAKLADVSYSLYLFHYPVLTAAGLLFVRHSAINTASLASCAAKGLLVIVVCIGFYALFEYQTGRVRRILRTRLPPAMNASRTASSNERMSPEKRMTL